MPRCSSASRMRGPGVTTPRTRAIALRAIAYRAVMRYTVNRTLSEALSENVVALTSRMRAMVQDGCRRFGFGHRGNGVHGRRNASAGDGCPGLSVGGFSGDREGYRCGECGGIPQSDCAGRGGFRADASECRPSSRAPKLLARRPAKPGAFARWSRSIARCRRITSSVAVWKRSRTVSRGVFTRSSIPAFSGMEVSCG